MPLTCVLRLVLESIGAFSMWKIIDELALITTAFLSPLDDAMTVFHSFVEITTIM